MSAQPSPAMQTARHRAASAQPTPVTALWKLAAISLPTGLALWLYWWRAAPGLTWAFYGADGGDLIAAAAVNGIPHPPGYPFYTLLLRGWLMVGNLVNAQSNPAYWGNRLSALCVAGAVAFTIAATAEVLRQDARRWLWAALAGLAFAITPLAWSQALITEVYGLHVLLVAAMGWVALRPEAARLWPALLLGILMGLGAAHHLTSLLLWPALLYWQLHALPRRAWIRACVPTLAIATVLPLLFYGTLIWRVAAATPPIAWGYPRDIAGLWWLISGAAYRNYVFGMTPLQYGGRLAALARLLVEQFTPVGLALVIGGFAVWDRQRPSLRNGAILWILPVSLYAAGYNTVDSYIYLLPMAWLMTLALGQGLASGGIGLQHRFPRGQRLITALLATLAVLALVVLLNWRLPQFDLRDDHEAQAFLAAAAATLEPGSVVISVSDAHTFALWYGQWGSNLGSKFKEDGTLAQAVPDLILVNYALYQFGWYRNLLHDQYPELPKLDATFAEFVAANRALRPIYFTEPLPAVPQMELMQTGIFWRLQSSTPK